MKHEFTHSDPVADYLLKDLKLPPQVQQKMLDYHSTTNEILRHFWSSFVPYKAEKNKRMVESLKRQKDKMNEVLITANSYKANLDVIKQVITESQVSFGMQYVGC